MPFVKVDVCVCVCVCVCAQWPDRYVPLFGSGAFDKERIRPDFISFEEQLRALQDLVKEGKVRL